MRAAVLSRTGAASAALLSLLSLLALACSSAPPSAASSSSSLVVDPSGSEDESDLVLTLPSDACLPGAACAKVLGQAPPVLVDGAVVAIGASTQCDISATAGTYAVDVTLAANANVLLEGNTIHDSTYGVLLSSNSIGSATFALTDNTLTKIADDALSLDLASNGSGVAVSYTGNAITSNGLGVDLSQSSDSTTLTHSGNVYLGNTNNYGGTAVPDGF